MNTYMKFAAAIILFGSWCVLVAYRMASADDLVAFVKYALAGLAAHQATVTPYPGESK